MMVASAAASASGAKKIIDNASGDDGGGDGDGGSGGGSGSGGRLSLSLVEAGEGMSAAEEEDGDEDEDEDEDGDQGEPFNDAPPTRATKPATEGASGESDTVGSLSPRPSGTSGMLSSQPSPKHNDSPNKEARSPRRWSMFKGVSS
jgi:hypothetical protein